MSNIQTLYKLMEVNSHDLEIPEAYQRRLNTNRVARIVAGFDERIANEPKVSFRDGRYFVFDGQHKSLRSLRQRQVFAVYGFPKLLPVCWLIGKDSRKK